MKGLLFGVVLNNWFAYFVNMGLVSRHIGYKWWIQLMNLLPVTMASVISAVLSYIAANLFDLSLYMDGLVKMSVYIMLYMGWSLIFKPEAFLYTKSIIIPMTTKIIGKWKK